jgi:iron complex outermembrane recepter protein
MSLSFRKLPLVAAVTLVATSPLTNAQLVLEEVIVTAQKRAESLQDVPISVTAMQGSKIQDAGISNMSALADYIPNFKMGDAPVSTNIYMRGMGSSNNQAFEQSVGMYIDGIYMGRGRQYRSPFMDIERVEVLRGPQGTLFGKNTVAGAVSVLTASPNLDDELNGRVQFTAESNDGYIGEGFVSGAVTDNFALRGAFKYRETEGYMENTLLNTDEPEVEETVYRITAVWEITEDLDANFKWGQSDYERTGVASAVSTYLASEDERNAIVPNRDIFASTAYLIMDDVFPNFGDAVNEEFSIFKDNGEGVLGSSGIGRNPESSDNDTDNAVLTLNYFKNDYTFTSVSGYSEYQYVDGADVDWLPLQFIHRDDDQKFDQISQEFRIASPTGGFFEYLAGAYYEESTLEFNRAVTIDTSLGGQLQFGPFTNITGALTGGQYTADQIRRTHDYKLDSDSWALFAQGTFNLTEVVRLTLGLRYTEENKDVTSSQFLSDDIDGLDVPNDNYFLGEIEAQNFDTYRYSYDEDRETDQWIPSINLQWDVTDDAMLYISYSEGFKSGGFTGADDGMPDNLGEQLGVGAFAWPCTTGQDWRECYDSTTPSDDFEFDDEEVVAWEIGGKHTLLGGAMNLNWAAFYTEYDNLQTSIFKGIGFGVTNAAEVTVQGLEFDLLWLAAEGLQIGLNGAWLDSEYDSYSDAPCSAVQLDADELCGQVGGTSNNDLAGENTTFAPEYTAALFFDYNFMLDNGMEIFVGGEANYSDDYDTQGDLDPVDRVDDYTKVNLRFGIRGAEEDWEVMFFGRNITDEEVAAYGFDVPVLVGTHADMYDEGEVYGARFSYRFE